MFSYHKLTVYQTLLFYQTEQQVALILCAKLHGRIFQRFIKIKVLKNNFAIWQLLDYV